VRNEHWKDRPAKPHDAAAHADREDDRAPANIVPLHKALANTAIRRRPSWDAAKVTRHLFEKAFDLLSLRL
jgi:hypothetical protein